MPSSITHELIADAASARLGIKIPAPDYYFLGAQGPDLFFFLKPLSAREYNLGKLLHRRRVAEWFLALRNGLPEDEMRGKCLSYALGFCTHLSADAVFHPFVYAYLAQEGVPKSMHQRIENDWDVYFQQKLRGKGVTLHAYPFDLDAIAKEGVLYSYLAPVMEGFRDVSISEGEFRRMLRGFSFYLNHFHGKNKALKAVGLGSLYPKPEADCTFLYGELFETLAGCKDADALFARAVEDSCLRMQNFLASLEGAPFDAALFSRHMLTGKPID